MIIKSKILIIIFVICVTHLVSCNKLSQTTIHIPEVGLELALPTAYRIEKSGEIAKRGSVSSYDITQGASKCPGLKRILFDTEASIEAFDKNCRELIESDPTNNQGACSSDDYSTLENSTKMKIVIQGNLVAESTGGKQVKPIGEHRYYVFPVEQAQDSDIFSQTYITYVNDVRITIDVESKLCGKIPDFEEKSSELIKQLSFEKSK
jgi:hypothetical protein